MSSINKVDLNFNNDFINDKSMQSLDLDNLDNEQFEKKGITYANMFTQKNNDQSHNSIAFIVNKSRSNNDKSESYHYVPRERFSVRKPAIVMNRNSPIREESND